MSNIFNFLGGTAGSDDKGQMTKLERSKTSYEIRPNSLKTMGGAKQKGLSIRSNSDMNISHSAHPSSIKKNICHNTKQDCLKLKVTQIDNNGRPISPGKEMKKLIAQPSKFKESAVKEEPVINKSMKIQSDGGLFKKPMPSKKSIKIFPEPEKLAHWYDDQYEFNYRHIETVGKEFKDLLSKEKENIEPCKEEELSDSETLLFPEIPKLVLDRSFDNEYKKLFSSDIPEISDISDDDNS